MSSEQSIGHSSYLPQRIILRDDIGKDGIKIKLKKPKKTRSLERPVCFRVRDRVVDGLPIVAPSFRPRALPFEPAYEVAPVVYVNPDGTTKRCGPNGVVTDAPKVDPECGCPLTDGGSAVEKTITKGGSEDEPLVIRIGPTGGFGNGCEEKPVYKINFKDNVMNVTSNIDFMVKKMERTQSTVEKDPEAQKYLIKPILKHIPPVTVTVRPNPIGNQTSTSTSVAETLPSEASARTRSVPNEYAENPSIRTRTVQPASNQYQISPEQLAAVFQQQQAPAPTQGAARVPGQTQQYQFTPEQIAAAYQQQQVGLPQGPNQLVISPEQIAAAAREQQGGPRAEFTPEQLAAAYQAQQGAGSPQFTPEQVAAAFREQLGGPRAPTVQVGPGLLPQGAPQQPGYAYSQGAQQQAYAYQQQAPPAPTQYAQPGAPQQQAYAYPQAAQQQAYAYPQQAPQAPTQYAQPGVPQQQAYAYPQAAQA